MQVPIIKEFVPVGNISKDKFRYVLIVFNTWFI